MRIVKALALVVAGVLLGAGLVLSGERLSAKTAQGVDERLELGRSLYAGDYPLRFIKDTVTGNCYLAGVGPAPTAQNPARTYAITAITQTDQMACNVH